MMNEKVPPFIDEEPGRVTHTAMPDVRGSLIMGGGWFLLTLALLAGAKLSYDQLTISPKPEHYSISAPLFIIFIAYLFGWILALINIRAMHNQSMPLIIKLYTFGVLGGILFVYGRVIYKIFIFPEDGDSSLLPSTSTYSLLLIAGYLVLVSLALLVRKFYLRTHATLLLIALGAHIIVAVYHYVFLGARQSGLISYDLYYMVVILVITLFLSLRYRIFRQMIALMFAPG